MLQGTFGLFDVRDVERLAVSVLGSHLRKTRATLTPADSDDAVAFLISTTWELSLEYDPKRSSSFSKYAYTRLQLRIVDWYRSRFYRDQTSTEWYRRRNPNAPPSDPEGQRNFHLPASLAELTENGGRQPAAPDHSDRDSVAFLVRALTADPAADCVAPLADVLGRRHSEEEWDLDLQSSRPDGRSAQ